MMEKLMGMITAFKLLAELKSTFFLKKKIKGEQQLIQGR